MRIVDCAITNPANKFAPYQRMANAIIERTRQHGGCRPQDLLALGFTQQETLDQWHMAHAMASIELKLMENETLPNLTQGKRYAQGC
jgi:hypothetical protein